jgi:hypothetical protein
MVATRLAVDPARVRVVVRTQVPEEIADAVENLKAAAAKRDEDPRWYAEANLHARRLLRSEFDKFERLTATRHSVQEGIGREARQDSGVTGQSRVGEATARHHAEHGREPAEVSQLAAVVGEPRSSR